MRAVPILMYHNIGHAPPRTRVGGLYVRPGAFRRQMAALRILGYRGLSMGEITPYLEGQSTGKVCGITFDDGYLDNLQRALPVLQRYGHRATCYIVSDRIGEYNVWDAERLGVRKRLMDAVEIERWLAAGMEIGAHTRTHVRLSRLDEQAARDEILGSQQVLEARFGVQVRQFCYPWGDYDERTLAVLRGSQFHAATTTVRARAKPPVVDLLQVPRVTIMRHHLLHAFLLKCFTPYEDRRGRAQGKMPSSR